MNPRIKEKLDIVKRKIGRNSRRVLRKFSHNKRRELTNQDLTIALSYSAAWPKCSLTEEQMEDLDDRLARLSQKEMHIVRLYFYEGKTQDEIGGLFGHNRSWACRQIQRCLDVMRVT